MKRFNNYSDNSVRVLKGEELVNHLFKTQDYETLFCTEAIYELMRVCEDYKTQYQKAREQVKKTGEKAEDPTDSQILRHTEEFLHGDYIKKGNYGKKWISSTTRNFTLDSFDFWVQFWIEKQTDPLVLNNYKIIRKKYLDPLWRAEESYYRAVNLYVHGYDDREERAFNANWEKGISHDLELNKDIEKAKAEEIEELKESGEEVDFEYLDEDEQLEQEKSRKTKMWDDILPMIDNLQRLVKKYKKENELEKIKEEFFSNIDAEDEEDEWIGLQERLEDFVGDLEDQESEEEDEELERYQQEHPEEDEDDEEE